MHEGLIRVRSDLYIQARQIVIIREASITSNVEIIMSNDAVITLEDTTVRRVVDDIKELTA